MITSKQIIEDVAQAVVTASSHWREDQVACWRAAASGPSTARGRSPSGTATGTR